MPESVSSVDQLKRTVIPIRVLFVDESPGTLADSLDTVSDDRLTITVESTAETGLSRLDDESYDCVVSGYRLADTDGLSFLERVRQRDPTLPFVLLVHDGSETLASDAISAGVTDYIPRRDDENLRERLVNRLQSLVAKHRAEQRAESYLQASPDGVVVVDRDGTIRRVNDRLEELFGYDASELRGEPIEKLLPERYREGHVAHFAEYTESPEWRPMSIDLDLFGRRADGTEFPVDIELSPLRVDGHLEFMASVRDATERRRRKQEMEELNRVNRTLRETVQAVSRAESRADIERAVCQTLADSDSYRFAWIGTVADGERVVPSAWAGIEDGYLDSVTVTVDERPTGQGPTGRAARTNEPQVLQDIRTDPAYEPWREAAEKRGYESSASIPLLYGDTRYGLLNLYADRPQAFDERELDVLSELGETVAHAIHRAELTSQIQAQYRTLFEEAPVMAVITRNEEGTPVVEDCNRLFVERLGYERAAVLGRPLSEFYTPSSVEKLFEEGGYERALMNEFTREERTLITADDDAVETLLRAVPRTDESGTVVGSLAMYVDVSERRRLERENERLDRFTSIVSHDLRNPLTVIKGRAELASEEHDSEDIDAIVQAAERMDELITGLLKLARLGMAIDERVAVELSRVVERAWKHVDTRDATLCVETDLVVDADEDRLQQLLENLIRNAVEHGGDDVTITVGDFDGGFYVADDGPGIPVEERPQVFEAGYSTSANGTGFGLSIVKEIAEAHDWAVDVTDSVDGGARFEIQCHVP